MKELKEQEVYVKVSVGVPDLAACWYDTEAWEWKRVEYVEVQSKILLSPEELRELLEAYRNYLMENIKATPQVNPDAYAFFGNTESFINQILQGDNIKKEESNG